MIFNNGTEQWPCVSHWCSVDWVELPVRMRQQFCWIITAKWFFICQHQVWWVISEISGFNFKWPFCPNLHDFSKLFSAMGLLACFIPNIHRKPSKSDATENYPRMSISSFRASTVSFWECSLKHGNKFSIFPISWNGFNQNIYMKWKFR